MNKEEFLNFIEEHDNDIIAVTIYNSDKVISMFKTQIFLIDIYNDEVIIRDVHDNYISLDTNNISVEIDEYTGYTVFTFGDYRSFIDVVFHSNTRKN